MRNELCWVQGPWRGRLAILPRPRGGDWLPDDVRAWRRAGIDLIVSLLTHDECADLNLTGEAEECESQGMQLLSYPIVDRGVPASRRATQDFVRKLDEFLAGGKNVAIHCRQGLGRSALVAACLLVWSGVEPKKALQSLSASRGCSVPETGEQRNWITEFGRALPTPLSKE